MNTSELLYQGDLRTIAVHSFSGNEIITDAPIDNQGKGQAFSPTDLLATAVGSCMLTIMGIRCRDKGWDLKGAKVEVIKHMASNPRRIAKIELTITVPLGELSDTEKQELIRLAHHCPVALSIHPDIQLATTFTFVGR